MKIFCLKTKNRIKKNIYTKQRIENFKLKALKPFKKADKSHHIFDSNHKKKSLHFSKGIDPTLHTIDEKSFAKIGSDSKAFGLK